MHFFVCLNNDFLSMGIAKQLELDMSHTIKHNQTRKKTEKKSHV